MRFLKLSMIAALILSLNVFGESGVRNIMHPGGQSMSIEIADSAPVNTSVEVICIEESFPSNISLKLLTLSNDPSNLTVGTYFIVTKGMNGSVFFRCN